MTASGSPAPTTCRNGAAVPDVDPAGVDMPQRFGNDGPHVAGVGRCARAGVAFSPPVRSQPSPERDGRTRPRGWSAFSRRDQPRGREPQVPHRYALAPAAKESTVRATNDEITRVAGSTGSYPLCGLLFCRCGARFCRSCSPASKREYRSVCGCRLRPLDADNIERLVRTAAVSRAPGAATLGGSMKPPEALFHLYSRIEVGGTVDDMRFVRRV